MRQLSIVMFVIFGALTAQAELPQVEGARVFCTDHFIDGIAVIDNTYKISSCAADVVWGFENTCYVGEAQDLVDRINNDEFNWKVGFTMSKAEVNADGITVDFWAHDGFMSGPKDITPCEPSFFEDKEIVNPEKL